MVQPSVMLAKVAVGGLKGEGVPGSRGMQNIKCGKDAAHVAAGVASVANVRVRTQRATMERKQRGRGPTATRRELPPPSRLQKSSKSVFNVVG